MKPLAIIYTEGKTDWKHLKRAQKELNIELPIEFYTSENSLGSSELLKMCHYLSKRIDNDLPAICIFDRDEPHILKKIGGKDKLYKTWENKYFSFALPIPEHRQGYDDNVCIEFYYTDDEIRTKDQNGRRLFLSTEFRERSKRHKYDERFVFGGTLKNITDDHTKAKIIDADVFDINDNNVTEILA
jgi:RNA-directed DNA polymerase